MIWIKNHIKNGSKSSGGMAAERMLGNAWGRMSRKAPYARTDADIFHPGTESQLTQCQTRQWHCTLILSLGATPHCRLVLIDFLPVFFPPWLISNCTHKAKWIDLNNPGFLIFFPSSGSKFWIEYFSWNAFLRLHILLERARHGCAPKIGEQGGRDVTTLGCMLCTHISVCRDSLQRALQGPFYLQELAQIPDSSFRGTLDTWRCCSTSDTSGWDDKP